MVLSVGLAYIIGGLIAASVITISYSSNDISAVDKFVSKGQGLGFQCQKGHEQPFPNLDYAGEYAYCAPLSNQFSIYYVPGRNSKNEYMATQESKLRVVSGVSATLRRGKYYLVIVGSSNNFQDTVSLQQLLRPTDLITFDPDGVARSTKTLAIPIYSQSANLKIAWNEVANDYNCSIQTRCVNLSLRSNHQAIGKDLCETTVKIAWLTKDSETTRIEEMNFSQKDNQYFSKNIYAIDGAERYVKIVGFGCQN